LTSFPETLAPVEQGRKRVLDVEDWAEIRRLRRSEGMSISQIERVVGPGLLTWSQNLSVVAYSVWPMTYLQAANKAQAAKGSAQTAASHAGDDYAQRQLATAVAQLAEAVEELAKTMHRES
jgi:hypothetical protein